MLRVVLKEKGMDFNLIYEAFWERNDAFLQLNPGGMTPTMIHPESREPVSSLWAIFEFLEAISDEPQLIYGDIDSQISIRRITDWFCNKFYNEVTKYIFSEKVIKVFTGNTPPNSHALRAAKYNLLYHIDYITYLLGNNDYVAGEKPSLADYAVAGQLSVLDYLDDMLWERSNRVQEWYRLIKSRPSFRDILGDRINKIQPSIQYSNLDFG